MIFDFKDFIEEIRSSEEKKTIVEKYEQYYEISDSIYEQRWYKDYLINFNAKPYIIPSEFEKDFDWILLYQLVFGSFSSKAKLIYEDNILPELEISVNSNDTSVVKKISQLEQFQIHRLFEIYVEEQINLQTLFEEDENEKNAIISQRNAHLQQRPTNKSDVTESIINPSTLFNFHNFIESLRDANDKKEIIEKYEKYYGCIKGDINEQVWFSQYVNQFDYQPYLVPLELKNEFDWVILYQLAFSSFSCTSRHIYNTDIPNIEIKVNSADMSVIKIVSELWSFQILRLYEIFIEEQINFQILIAEDEIEKEAILKQRNQRLNNWVKLKNKRKILTELELINNE